MERVHTGTFGGRFPEVPATPLRAAPAVAEGQVLIITADNQLYTLDADTGQPVWRHAGFFEGAGLLGGPSPAVDRGVVVVPYSSAEVFALRVDNGRPVWNETMIGARGDVRAFGNLTDIRGRPVIDRGLVLAMGTAGQLPAVELRSGQRVWERGIGGSQTPWTAGRFVFVTTALHALCALALTLPGEADIAREISANIDPDAVFAGREALTATIAKANAAVAGGVNVEIIRVSGDDLVLDVFERGAGRTQACGTGACAAAAVANDWGLVGTDLKVRMPGGIARIGLGETVTLAGPVNAVAKVEYPWP